jgi:very-short-patch-repair endonuclease
MLGRVNDEIAFMRAIRDLLQSRPLDAVIAYVAALQHGVIARWQLRLCGLDKDAVQRRRNAGRLHPVHRGVYAVGHNRLTRLGRFMAVVLAAGEGAVLSHRSAAALLRIRKGPGPKLEVTVPRTAPRTTAFVARRSKLEADEIEEIDGIPCTTVSRTLLDLAAIAPPSEVARAIKEADYLRLTDTTGIHTLIQRHPRRRGLRALREALAEAAYGAGHTKEEMEARMKHRLFAENLPPPEFNAQVELGEQAYEVDIVWRSARLIVELDGWQAHGTRHGFESDRERDRRLAAAGYRVIRVTWTQLGDPALMGDLRAILAAAAADAA